MFFCLKKTYSEKKTCSYVLLSKIKKKFFCLKYKICRKWKLLY